MPSLNLSYFVLIITLIYSLPVQAEATFHQFERDLYQKHAKELLGKKSYGVHQVSELSSDDIHYELEQLIQHSMDRKYSGLGDEVVRSIVKASKLFQLDPFLLSAVIASESGFNPNSVGSSGEVGLMQVLPTTAQWIANKYHFHYAGRESLKFPMVRLLYFRV